MKDLIELCKLFGIKYYDDSIDRIEFVEYDENLNMKVGSNEYVIHKVFSRDDLIDGRFHHVRGCKLVSGSLPIYTDEGIEVLGIDDVIKEVIDESLKEIEYHVNNLSYRMYKKGDKFIFMTKYSLGDDEYTDVHKGDNANEVKVHVLNKVMKHLNKIKRELSKISKKS